MAYPSEPAYLMGNVAPYAATGQAPVTNPYSQGDQAMYYPNPVDANNPNNPNPYHSNGYAGQQQGGYGGQGDGYQGGQGGYQGGQGGYQGGQGGYQGGQGGYQQQDGGYGANNANNLNAYNSTGHGSSSHNSTDNGSKDDGTTISATPAPNQTTNNTNQTKTSNALAVAAGTTCLGGFFGGIGQACVTSWDSIKDCFCGCAKCCED